MFDRFPEQAARAQAEAWHAELGHTDRGLVHSRIAAAVGPCRNWVLLGGPPCQAYSLVGRSRNRGNPEYRPENDRRQFLYLEYLQVLADHEPAVFVMENVKGLLSATHSNRRVFERILEGIESPATAIRRESRTVSQRNGTTPPARYRLHSIVRHGLVDNANPKDFIVPMERTAELVRCRPSRTFLRLQPRSLQRIMPT